MLGMIARCLQEMVISHYGNGRWQQVSSAAGLDHDTVFAPVDDLHDDIIDRLFDSTCRTLDLNFVEVCDLFGEYWVNAYAPRVYRHFYDSTGSAQDFLLQLNHMHSATTASIQNASPPSFVFQWQDAKNLVIHYQSHRNLIELAAGLVRGVGRHFNEEIEVSVIKPEKLNIRFL